MKKNNNEQAAKEQKAPKGYNALLKEYFSKEVSKDYRNSHPELVIESAALPGDMGKISSDIIAAGKPAVMNILNTGLEGPLKTSQAGLYDIAMLSHIPNFVYLAPTTWEELAAMEKWAMAQDKFSVAIRVSAMAAKHDSDTNFDTDYSELNKFKLVKKGQKVAIIAAGDFFQKGQELCDALDAKENIQATLINPRYLTGVDRELLHNLEFSHQLVVTLEDGTLDGGFGERIARFYGPRQMKVLNFGVKKQLYDNFEVEQLMADNNLTDDQIFAEVKKALV